MRQVGLLGVCLWVVALACIAGLLQLSGGRVDADDLGDYGLVFLGYVVISNLVARRRLDVSMVLVALWGGAIGFWGPRWYNLCETAINRWGGQAGLEDVLAGSDTRLAISIVAGGILTAALLYISTRSSQVVIHTVIASLMVAGLMKLPVPDVYSEPAAVVTWNAVVAAGLCRWMVDGSHRRRNGCCPRCGSDVEGLTSPVCPSCSAVLADKRGSTVAAVVAPAAFRRPV